MLIRVQVLDEGTIIARPESPKAITLARELK